MSLLPRLNDTFATSPLTDPLYRFSGTWTYNSGQQRLETTTALSYVEVLNSQNSYGTVIINMNVNVANSEQGQAKAYVRAFGYYYAIMRTHTYIIDDNDLQWLTVSESGAVYGYSTNQGGIARKPYMSFLGNRQGQDLEIKIVSTPLGVAFYCGGALDIVMPHKSNIKNVRFGIGGNESPETRFYDLLIKADSSPPKQPFILEPAEAGSINAAQEVSTTVPESRLFVDLGSYSPGITGLTNVFYDPGGANVAMAEDTGIPTRSGGTTGDYYLEIPSNGVAYDYRLVIKEDFVTANTVVTTDTIDFDVTGGPSGQTGTVTEDDDLQCYVKVSNEVPLRSGETALPNLAVYPVVHNYNADGNNVNISNGSFATFFDGDGGTPLRFNSAVSFPILFDLDLGKVFQISRVNAVNSVSDGPFLSSWDIYSNTVPFSGASLLQGTLEYTSYPLVTSGASPGSFLFPYLEPGQAPTLNFYTRYLRFAVPNSSYFSAGLSGTNTICYECVIKVVDYQTLNSVDDNAQFEFDSGGGFGAFPAGGVTQNSGNVRVTLTGQLQVGPNNSKFLAVQFRADLTD